MTALDLAPLPLAVLRLRGTQAEMGRQHGELIRSLGGHEAAIDFYPRMASAMLSLPIEESLRPHARKLIRASLGLGARRLYRARRGHFPDFAARTDALCRAGGFGASTGRAMVVMDVLQNTVGTLGRLGLLEATGAGVAALAACTSVAVWDEGSKDGQLRHARNFDFPGVGVWDRAPSVVFCDPDEGVRYGFVTTRGADAPGVTAFNEAGITLTAHTRFHRDVDFDGVAVMDIGHEIARRARTLDEAVTVVRRMRVASSWGYLVSSAAERRAIVIETTSRGVFVTEHSPERAHLVCTNRYLNPSARRGEVNPSHAFVVDSESRHRRADEEARSRRLGLEDLERLLGDFRDPHAGPDGEHHLAGNCITSPMTVKSVVFEPERAQLSLSVGRAPTGLGPYVNVPYRWDGEVGATEVNAPEPSSPRAGRRADQDRSEGARMATRLYAAASREHVRGARAAAVGALLEAASEAAPDEPHLAMLCAFFRMGAGELGAAADHLERALPHAATDYRRAQVLLWLARVEHARGERSRAAFRRRELMALASTDATAPLIASAQRDATTPPSRARLRRIVPDVLLVDASLPGG